jgi:hypothetical protein
MTIGRPSLGLAAVLFAAGSFTGLADSVEAVRARVEAVSNNAAAVYWRAFDSLTNVTERQWEALRDDTLAPGEAAEVSRRLQSSLALRDQAAAMEVCNWGVDYAQGPEALMPHLAGARRLVAAANWEAARTVSNSPARAVQLWLGNLALSRYVASDSVLIAQLVAIASEGKSYEQMARWLPDLPAPELSLLADGLVRKEPETRWQRAMTGEREHLVGWMLNRLIAGARSNAAAVRAESPAATTNRLARDLRLSSLLQIEGEPIRIGLDDAVGNRSYWLSPGQSENGVTLVSADYGHNEAVVARDGETAIVHLEGLGIVPVEISLSQEQIRDFASLFGAGAADVGDGGDLSMKVGGPRGIVRDLMELQNIEDEWGAWSGWKSPEDLRVAEESAKRRLGPMGEAVLVPLATVYETLFAAEVREQMMRAAIGLRQEDLEALTDYPDPTDGKPFEVRPVSGGYELVSRATRKGEPVVLRVGK